MFDWFILACQVSTKMTSLQRSFLWQSLGMPINIPVLLFLGTYNDLIFSPPLRLGMAMELVANEIWADVARTTFIHKWHVAIQAEAFKRQCVTHHILLFPAVVIREPLTSCVAPDHDDQSTTLLPPAICTGHGAWAKMSLCAINSLRFGDCLFLEHNLAYLDWYTLVEHIT